MYWQGFMAGIITGGLVGIIISGLIREGSEQYARDLVRAVQIRLGEIERRCSKNAGIPTRLAIIRHVRRHLHGEAVESIDALCSEHNPDNRRLS